MPTGQHADDKAVALLMQDPQFHELSDLLARFNIFRVLGVEDVEIRHSNTLAWLLDPNESHGLGSLVLRRFLSSILLGSRIEVKGISAAQVELLDFAHIEVRREWHRFDVLVVDRANRLVLLVENKVHASISRKQLEHYLGDARAEFPEFTIIPVLLTLSEWDDEDEGPDAWIPFGYPQLLSVLEQAIGQKNPHQLADGVVPFLHHYMEIIRRLTMQDEPITKLCRDIYRKHRQAVDLIVEAGMSSVLEDAAVRVLEGSHEILARNPRWVWFIPNSWVKVVPENGVEWGHLSRRVSIACWFHQVSPHSTRIHLTFEVCRMANLGLRRKCVEALRDAGFNLTKKAYRKDARYSRFYHDVEGVEDFGDPKVVEEAVGKLLVRAQAHFEEARKALKSVFPRG